MPIAIPVTLLYGGLNALLIVALGINVSRLRRGTRTGPGAALPPELVKPVRAHGNAAEWVPLGLVLLLSLEVSGAGSRFMLHLLGGSFFLGRVLHAGGLFASWKLHGVGAALNYLVITYMAVWAVALRFAR
jgi:uncharacterized membrane protein YecN with MAPEG domain